VHGNVGRGERDPPDAERLLEALGREPGLDEALAQGLDEARVLDAGRRRCERLLRDQILRFFERSQPALITAAGAPPGL
jgi:hypothetical protein